MENLFGKNLRFVRKKLGLTQNEFAKTIGYTGGYVSDVERGKTGYSESFIQLIEVRFNLNREWLTTGVGEMFLPQQSMHSDPIVDKLVNEEVLKHSELGELDTKEVRAIKILRKLSPERRQRILDQLVDALILEQE